MQNYRIIYWLLKLAESLLNRNVSGFHLFGAKTLKEEKKKEGCIGENTLNVKKADTLKHIWIKKTDLCQSYYN